MLSSIVRDHEQIITKKNEKIKAHEKKTAILAAKYAKDLSLKINEPIRACYQNEKKCDMEVRRLVTESDTLGRLAMEWSRKLTDFDDALRDLGDVEAYSYAIERETNILLNATKMIIARKESTNCDKDGPDAIHPVQD